MDPVAIVGTGPAVDVLAATLADESVPHEHREELAFADATVGVVVDRVGADAFARADDVAIEADLPWVAIELGGVGGYPLVEASVAGLEPDGPCYRCLRGRVEANADTDAEPVPAPGGATARVAGAVAGRNLAASLEPDRTRPIDRSEGGPFGRVVEVPHADRTLLPLPGCDCGPVPDREVRREGTAMDLEAALDRAQRGLDRRVGIIDQIGEGESYPAAYYLAELCDTGVFSDTSAPRQAAGVAAGWNEAFMKAAGESYERYAAGVYRADDFVHATPDALVACVAPDAFVAPSDGAPFGTDGGSNVESGSDDTGSLTDGGSAGNAESDTDGESGVEGGEGGDGSTVEQSVDGTEVDEADGATGDELAWYPAADLATGAETHVPADLVVHPPPSREVRPAITTGLGLGSSGADALLSGLYEVIERDAAMLAWYSTYEPLGLSVADDEYRTLARRVEADGLSVTPLLVTQDVDVPVVAVAVHREKYPKLAFGSAANLDPQRAARGALAEAVQNWMELRSMGPEAAAEAGGAIGRYATDFGPAEPWLDPDSEVAAATVGPDDPPTGTDAVDPLVDRLADADLAAYAARTTTRDLAILGFEAVRVLVPSAQPLFLGEAFFGTRAETVPESLGFEPRTDRERHPFP